MERIRFERWRVARGLVLFLLLPLLTTPLLYLPDPPMEQMRFGPSGLVIADRNGSTLYSVPAGNGGYQHRLSWAGIPEPVREIFVRLEDRRFYNHGGVDGLAAARAFYLNIRERRVVSGASTVTMQLARLIRPHGGGLPGKAAEIFGALYLEARLSKRQILLLYLNNLPFGYNTLGVGAAARTYFSLPLEELSRAQILLLAVIPKAPGLYDPFSSSESRAALKKRAVSLASLLSVSSEEIDRAMGTFHRGGPEFRAPHFVRFLLEILEDRGLTGSPGVEVVRVLTTLDSGLHEALNRSVREHLAAAGRGGASGGAGDGGAARLQNAAALILNNRSGEVLAWVGSQDFFDRDNGGQIDGVRLKSSSGSTLKPYLYAAALERGYTAATLLPDLALTFGAGEGYRPENFDRRSRGLVRLRTALASSLNVPAVYILSQLGLEEFLAVCRELEIDLPADAAARAGLGAAVGNLEVSLLELTRAFGVFPNGGALPDLRLILELQTADDRRLPTADGAEGKRVFREQTAWLIADILADPAARVTGFGPASRFNTSFPALFKSGTASEYTSLWCLGALPAYTVGVWAGNFDGRSAFGTTGSSLPAAVVVDTLEKLRRGFEAQTAAPIPDPPPGLREVRICSQTGYAASPGCPAVRREYFLSGSEPDTACPVHGQGRTMEDLLLQVMIGEEGQPKVLFPRNGMIFYRERGTAVDSQRIPGWIAAAPGDRITVRLNGRILPLDDARRLLLPVQPGRYRLEVQGRSGGDSVDYWVR